MNTTSKEGSLFELDGVPKLSQAFPLALQHVVAMIVGCVTPAIIISGAAGLETADRVLLIQASLVVSALATLLQLFPNRKEDRFSLRCRTSRYHRCKFRLCAKYAGHC